MAAAVRPDELAGLGTGARVIDVRETAAFAAGHLEGAGHVPLAQLATRRAELPAREQRILVIAEDADQALRGAQALEAMGYDGAMYLDAPCDALPGARAAHGPGVRLWSPAPFLAEVAERIPRGRALDVAAGSCRNAVFLATLGFDAEAVDVASEALATGEALAASEGVRITTWTQDLEREPRLPAERYALVVCFRFLFRALFPALLAALAPGGHLVYETYRKGVRRYARPKRPRFLLEPGELRAAFPTLEVLQYDEPEPDGGPATSRLWARRPPDDTSAR